MEWSERLCRRLAVAVALLLMAQLMASAAAFYVSPVGDDSAPGSLTDPWRTIQHAADHTRPGDSVYLRGGIYREAVTISCLGTEVDPILFAACEGEIPILDGEGLETSALLRISGATNLTICGLEVRNVSGGNGIWITGSSNLHLADCRVHHAYYGIGIADGTHHFELARVEVHDVTLYGIDVDPAGGRPCFEGRFVDCIVHTASDATQNVDGFALGHGMQYGFEFARCTARGLFDGFDISARETLLEGCLAEDCSNGGYKIWQDDVHLRNCIARGSAISNVELDWDGEPGTITLDHCTLIDAGVFNIWIENSGDSLRLRNCVLAGGDNIGLAFEQRSITGYEGASNLFHTEDGRRLIAVGYQDEFSATDIAGGAWSLFSGEDEASLSFSGPADALFVDLVSGDLAPSIDSPVVEAASGSLTESDFLGTPRPQDADGDGLARPDIGAIELLP